MRNLITFGLISRVRFAFVFVLAALIAGCGGGGGGSPAATGCLPYQTDCTATPGSGGGDTTTATPTQLSLSLDTPTIQTDGSSEVAVSATVKDSKNNLISGVDVTFSADSGALLVTTPKTGADGIAKAIFNSNGNKTNRKVTITATVGALPPKTTELEVQGTRLGFGGDSSAVRGKTVSMTVTLLDGAGKGVNGEKIALTSKLGNPVPASVTTDVNGQASISFMASEAGTDTITASALGAVLSQGLSISAVDFAFASPAADTQLTINTCHPVSVQLNGVLAAEAVFSVSRGKVFGAASCAGSGSDLQTIAFSGGSATAYVRSASAGAATVLAELSGGSVTSRASLPVKFVATVPTQVIVQSDPSVVAVNGSSSITAVVKDVAGNPVSGATVSFSASGGGEPSPTTAVTNDAGIATTAFKADSSISGKDSVVITASVLNGPSESSTLTVAGKAVNVIIGTGNQISLVESPPRYRKVWGVLVSDSAGGSIKNQSVTISLRGVEFQKGDYVVTEVDQDKKWFKMTSSVCPAEDANNDGVVGVGEVGDQDGDRVLEPNGAAIVRSPTSSGGALSATVTTDDSGAAEFWVEYPRDYASWVKVELMATATVSGKNSVAARSFYLPVPSSEVNDVTNSPSFQLSPFGQAASCNLH